MKLKPFDLQAALRGETVVHKDGRVALAVRHIPELNEDYRVLVAWKTHAPVSHYTEDGKSAVFYPDPLLFMAPKKVTKWGRLLRNKVGSALYPHPFAYDTKKLAEMDFVPQEMELVTIFPIEFEE